MSIPPAIVSAARRTWRWQWNQLMNGLAPADSLGNYLRPQSKHKNAKVLDEEDLSVREKEQLPRLIIGRSCPWAHRTWLIHELRGLDNNLKLLIAKPDHETGRWMLNPAWLECNSLLGLYLKCESQPNLRATVPALIDPGSKITSKPSLLGNESAQIVEVLNKWPAKKNAPDFAPKHLLSEIESWHKLLQPAVNEGVYKCGFARTQEAYEMAIKEMFNALNEVEKKLSRNKKWLCGNEITLADLRLFPTLIRWEIIYMPLFGCSARPLWSYPSIWKWRQRLMSLPGVSKTCNSTAWRKDYFGALFPLRPSGIIPAGPELEMIVKASPPLSSWVQTTSKN